MDLYAYCQIDDLKKYLEENNIDVPRLRGLRLMKEQAQYTKKDVETLPLYFLPKERSINNLHGKRKKKFKLFVKRFKRQMNMFNKYVGKNVLYVHARIGGTNWACCGGSELEKHPLYLERVDDYFDPTYCDIYFKLKEN